MSETSPTPAPLHPEQLTWAVLLTKWVELAKSAAALGPDTQSQTLRKLVPDIIMLQAVWFTLGDLDKLEMTEQKLGCLRALWLIDRHEKIIRDSWPDEQLPALLLELIDDAKAAYEKACKHVSDHDTDDQDDAETHAADNDTADNVTANSEADDSECPEPDSGPSHAHKY